MRIALCLFGETRDYVKAAPAWNKFMKKYQPDIFWHTWNSPPVLGVFSYNLKAGLVEAPQKFDTYGVTEYSSTARNVLPQMFSIYKVNQLMEHDERLNQQNYDFVIRARFDLFLHNPESIDFDSLDPTKYYVCANHWGGDQGIFDDNIMVASGNNGAKLNDCLFSFTSWFIKDSKTIPSGEQLLFYYFSQFGYMKDLVRTDALNFTLARNL